MPRPHQARSLPSNASPRSGPTVPRAPRMPLPACQPARRRKPRRKPLMSIIQLPDVRGFYHKYPAMAKKLLATDTAYEASSLSTYHRSRSNPAFIPRMPGIGPCRPCTQSSMIDRNLGARLPSHEVFGNAYGPGHSTLCKRAAVSGGGRDPGRLGAHLPALGNARFAGGRRVMIATWASRRPRTKGAVELFALAATGPPSTSSWWRSRLR